MPNKNVHAVVMAGGSGTRFWPLSRQHKPKQLLNLTGQGSLLAQTVQRIQPCLNPSHTWLVVGAHHAQACMQEVPLVNPSQVLIEPRPRNTAAAVALAAWHLVHSHPEAVMVVLPSDQYIRDEETFIKAIEKAIEVAQQGFIATLGITPTGPETGFGYIEKGLPYKGIEGAFHAVQFCEKPSEEKARMFVLQGTHDWNAGIFVMKAQVFLDALAQHRPVLFEAMLPLKNAIGTQVYSNVLNQVYQNIESISVDYAVMEHAQNKVVVPVACGWSDVGSWNALHTLVKRNAEGHVVQGQAVMVDAHHCTVYSVEGKVVAVVGLDHVVVVQSEDATLVMPQSRAQDVRAVIDALGAQGWHGFL
jgi:mannose-1-phosphate guanylyltransferase